MEKHKRKNDDYRINSYLQSDEKVLWTGKPNPWRLLRDENTFSIFFTLFYCGMTYIAFIGFILTSNWEQVLAILIIPIFWVALWLFPIRFIYKYYCRRLTLYAVTDRRLLILDGSIFGSFTSYDIKQLPVLSLHERRNKSGTIKFSGRPELASNKQINHEPISYDFYDIDNVKEVYDLVQELQYGQSETKLNSSLIP